MSGNIIALGISHERMQVEAIHRFQGTLLNVFMRTVHRIACLETNNTFPTTFYKQLARDRKSTRLNSSHVSISYAVFCLKKKKKKENKYQQRKKQQQPRNH